MTSAKLFSSFLRENRRQKVWIFVLSSILFIAFTFSYFMQEVLVYSDQMFFGVYNVHLMLLTVLIAAVSAFHGFGFLLQEKTTDFYFSLPVKREHLFWANYINGILLYLIPMLLSQFVCMLLTGGYGRIGFQELTVYFLWGIFIHMLAYLLFYHLTITAVLLAGHLVSAVGIFLLLVYYIKVMIEEIVLPLCGRFFETFYKSNLIEMIQHYFVPWNLYENLNGFSRQIPLHPYDYLPEWKEIAAVLAFSGILLVLCIIMLKKRRAEASGETIAFFKMERMIHVVIDILAALLLGNSLMASVEGKYQLPMGILGCLLGTVLCYIVLEMVFRMRFRKIRSRKLFIAGEAVGAVMILMVFWIGADSYDGYVPKRGKITSVGVSIAGMDEREPYYFLESRLESVELTGEELEKTHEWITDELVGKAESGKGKSGGKLTEVTIAYNLVTGGRIYRTYPIYEAQQLEKFSDVYATAAYKKGIYEVFSYTNYEDIEVSWTNEIENMTLDLDENQTRELLETYQKEMAAFDIESAEEEFPIGRLILSDEMFQKDTAAYLYPGFEKTITLLSGYGVPVEKKVEEYAIAKVEVTTYREGTKVTQKRDIYTDPEEMKEIASRLVYEGYVIQPVLNPVDTSTKVEVKFENSGHETVYTVDYYMKE